MTPAWVRAAVMVGELRTLLSSVASPVKARASPKSSSLIPPWGVILMFAGLRSRCMTPLSWANSRPSAIWMAIETTSSTGKAPPAPSRSERSWPGTISMTRIVAPSTSSMPNREAMRPWCSPARVRASRRKRARRSLSSASWGGSSFRATSRPSLVSVAW